MATRFGLRYFDLRLRQYGRQQDPNRRRTSALKYGASTSPRLSPPGSGPSDAGDSARSLSIPHRLGEGGDSADPRRRRSSDPVESVPPGAGDHIDRQPEGDDGELTQDQPEKEGHQRP